VELSARQQGGTHSEVRFGPAPQRTGHRSSPQDDLQGCSRIRRGVPPGRTGRIAMLQEDTFRFVVSRSWLKASRPLLRRRGLGWDTRWARDPALTDGPGRNRCDGISSPIWAWRFCLARGKPRAAEVAIRHASSFCGRPYPGRSREAHRVWRSERASLGWDGDQPGRPREARRVSGDRACMAALS
jgi:hypothetical protein